MSDRPSKKPREPTRARFVHACLGAATLCGVGLLVLSLPWLRAVQAVAFVAAHSKSWRFLEGSDLAHLPSSLLGPRPIRWTVASGGASLVSLLVFVGVGMAAGDPGAARLMASPGTLATLLRRCGKIADAATCS